MLSLWVLMAFWAGASDLAPFVSQILRMMGRRAESFNSLHGGAFMTYNGDMIEGMLADEPGIQALALNGILYEWLGLKGQSEVTLNGRLQGFATNNGAFNWSSLGTF